MMKKITLLLASCFVLGQNSFAQTGINDPLTASADQVMLNFIQKWNIPGGTYAITSPDGRIIYHKSFGYADADLDDGTNREVLQPYHLFRIGDLSQHITSVAIMKLIEEGRLNMNDLVFGPTGVLKDHPVFSQANITDSRVFNITVYHLLQDLSGLGPGRNCFTNPTTPYSDGQVGGCQPLHVPLHVAHTYGLDRATPEAYIRYNLEKGLNWEPGYDTVKDSGMNYMVLGEIIEEITGTSYENYVKTALLAPLGIFDMHIGRSLRSDKLEREVEYKGDDGTWLSSYNANEVVPWEYGGWNVETQGPYAGWVATAKDMLKFLAATDGRGPQPDILSEATINTMTAKLPNWPTYNSAQSWWVSGQGGVTSSWWNFSQALTGTSAMYGRIANGLNFIILFNRYPYGVVDGNLSHNPYINELDALWAGVYNAFTGIPTYDLMASPTINSKDITFANATSTSVDVSWTSGNGDKRMLVVSQGGTPVASYPLEGATYTANASFGSGADLGSGAFVAYNGTGNSITITGLSPETAYSFKVYEYNQNTTTGDHALYLLGQSAAANFTTPNALGIAKEADSKAIGVYPNPSNGYVNINLTALPGEAKSAEVTIANMQGVQVLSATLNGKAGGVDAKNLTPGVYIMRINVKGTTYTKRFVKI
ncbi:serine hydrolase [Rufibacter roseus]|uniref:Serine hydrolase n=1 Tax=Rufibacter roseus TaxID=1567108 RepID=A0ABW2DLB9_9BACT|nr:serine hydrolase [Rufibacter roseus]